MTRKRKVIFLISLYLVLLFISSLLYGSSYYTYLHESLHCFGASLINYDCEISGTTAHISPNIQKGEFLKSFIYSGMPFIVGFLIILIIYSLKSRLFNNLVIGNIMSLFLFVLFIQFMSFIEFFKEGNDFGNIIIYGSFIDRFLIVFITIFSICLIWLFSKEMFRKNKDFVSIRQVRKH